MEEELVRTESSLELKRVFQAPVALVYRAWTEPEMMDRWFHPDSRMSSSCSVDLRVGGRYEIQMRPGGDDGPHVVEGVYREVIPEEKLVFTWRWQGDEKGVETLVTVTFRPVGDGATELTLLHEQFQREEERESHAKGWQGTFEQLVKLLA